MIGAELPKANAYLTTKYVGERFDQAAEQGRLSLDPYTVADLSTTFIYSEDLKN